MRVIVFLIAASLVAVGCGDETTPASDNPVSDNPVSDDPVSDENDFPEVLAAEATRGEDGTWRVSATISSPYDGPDRYADAWRILGPDGAELGLRILTHDHANEQPFTRSLAGIVIPAGVETVMIEGRDLVNGWSGQLFELPLEPI